MTNTPNGQNHFTNEVKNQIKKDSMVMVFTEDMEDMEVMVVMVVMEAWAMVSMVMANNFKKELQ